MDLTRFHDAFFQEGFERLLELETGVLALSKASADGIDPEVINTVFRAAHSIKGASATLGFDKITQLTHLLETILGVMRDGGPLPERLNPDVLLQAVDCLRDLLGAQLEQRAPDEELLRRAKQELEAVLESPRVDAAMLAMRTEVDKIKAANVQPDIQVRFRPFKSLFMSGSDPLMFLKELDGAGQMQSVIDLSQVPSVGSLNTEDCFLGWDIALRNTFATPQTVEEIFDWIEGQCELGISLLTDREPVVAKAENKSVKKTEPARHSVSIRVATDKVDSLVNLVGELVITQSMLISLGDEFQMAKLAILRENLVQLTRNTKELQETVLKIRMLPIAELFDRFPRLVHDLCRKLGKAARLTISGEQTELDKTVLEKLSDPLLHLVRNSMDHGLESPAVRREIGKPDEGTLHLHAEHRGGNVVIQISDDGRGLDEDRILARARQRGLISESAQLSTSEIHQLIFEPGFSTNDQVTDLSGRGVGMDVVRRNVEELGGRIDLSSSAGFGTTTTIQLPLTLAIMEGQLVRVGGQLFVIPLVAIIELLRIDRTAMHNLGAGAEIYWLRGEHLRIVDIEDIFRPNLKRKPRKDAMLVVVEAGGQRVALRVDDLLVQQQVVLKSLEKNFGKVNGLAGATILGDGSIAMILDIAGIIQYDRRQVVSKHAEGAYELVSPSV